jgi:hypothetical protein
MRLFMGFWYIVEVTLAACDLSITELKGDQKQSLKTIILSPKDNIFDILGAAANVHCIAYFVRKS